jgi:hypothetical protein
MRELILPDGRYDNAAIIRDARRQWFLMGRCGWTWSRCLTFSWTKARAQRRKRDEYLAICAGFRSLPHGKPRAIDIPFAA